MCGTVGRELADWNRERFDAVGSVGARKSK